jgi:hypothetical protein
MKLYRYHPCSFKKLIKEENGDMYYTSKFSNISFNEMKNNCFYIMNLKINYDINTHSCLFLFKNNKLLIHKNASWKNTNGNDLDISNYENYNLNPDFHDLKCFIKINTKDYIKDNQYYENIKELL